jgi:hypothetical protein
MFGLGAILPISYHYLAAARSECVRVKKLKSSMSGGKLQLLKVEYALT